MQEQKPNIQYFKLAGILFIPLITVISYALSGKEIAIGPVQLQKANIQSYFTPHQSIPADSLSINPLLITPQDTAVIDTAAQRILLFGDSMVEGLSKRMRNYAAENGHELLNVIWYSSSTKIWAQYDTLNHYIRQFQPTYLMLCLGGNELFVRDLDKRDSYIQNVIKKMGDKPFVWLGPPNWKEDTGINSLIEKNAGTGRYFPSKRLTFQRGNDGAHPTMASAAQWMDSVAVWIANESDYRIRMALPQSKEQHGRTVVLKPLK